MAKRIDDEPIVDVGQAFSKTEFFIEQNKKTILTIVGLIIVVIGGYYAYKFWYVAGQETEARSKMYKAEQYFEKDSINKAMNGDKTEDGLGFIQIADDYSVTPSGNLAEYYLGVCYLKTGKFEDAIEHLKKFDSNDEIVSGLATAAIGDANMELGKTDEAISYYLKAAEQHTNNYDTPMCLKKAALANEEKGNYADAVKLYERIKNEFPETADGKEMEKYIARAKTVGNL